MASFHQETILSVRHWTDGHPLLRAYSIASANPEQHLEFLSIKVDDGPLTSKLHYLEPDVFRSNRPENIRL